MKLVFCCHDILEQSCSLVPSAAEEEAIHTGFVLLRMGACVLTALIKPASSKHELLLMGDEFTDSLKD